MFFWITTGMAVILTLFLVGGLYFTMGKEGRFHMGRFFRRGGIDLLQYMPLSKELVTTKINWDGKYWTEGKDAIMNGIELEKDTTPTAEQYNKAITASGRWAGSKRPVLMATQEMFFVFSHGFLEMLGKASRFQKYMKRVQKYTKRNESAEDQTEEDQKAAAIEERKAEYQTFLDELEQIKTHINESDKYMNARGFVYGLLSQVQAGYTGVKIQTIVTADEISKYLEGAPSRVLREARQAGKNEGGLEMTKPDKGEGLPPMVKAIAISASVIMAIVIAYVVITGQNPIDSVKGVLPN